MMHDEINWDGHDRERRQNLRERASAEFARDFSGQPNRYRSGEGWEKTHADERVTKKMAPDPRHERDERWMIDIPPIEMLAASEIIKFIPKNSVATCGQEMKKEFRAGEVKNDGRPGPKLRSRS